MMKKSYEIEQGTLDDFVALIDRCKAQVQHDASGYLDNPHLWSALHRVYLRLCHGSIPDYSVTEGAHEKS